MMGQMMGARWCSVVWCKSRSNTFDVNCFSILLFRFMEKDDSNVVPNLKQVYKYLKNM